MSGSGKPYYQETWFEYAFLAGCFLLGYLLFKALMPPVSIDGDIIQTLAMSRLLTEGRWLDAFAQFNMPPVYPALLALVIKIRHTTDLPLLIDSFYALNLGLYMASLALVYYFAKRQIHKPYSFAITALYALSPMTLGMLWSLDSQITYVVLSLGTLLAIDISLSQSSSQGSQLSRKEFSICGGLLGLSILTRQVGYTLLAAFFFILIKRHGLKKALSTLGILLLCLSPFVGRDLFGAVRSPGPYLASTATFMQGIGRYGLLSMVQSYADDSVRAIADYTVGNLNLKTFDEVADMTNTSGPSSVKIAQKVWGRWLLAFLAITGAIYGLYQYTGIGSIYLCTYTLTALVLLPRHGLPLSLVLPLLLFALYYGISKTAQWSKPLHFSSSKVLGPLITAWILLCSFSEHLAGKHGASLFRYLNRHTPSQQHHLMYMSVARKPETRLEAAQTETAHRRASEWLKRNLATKTPESVARRAVPVSGEPTADSPPLPTEDSTAAGSLRSDYLVEESSGKITPMKPGALQSAHGLQLVYEDVAGKIRIWQINSDRTLR